MRLFISVELPDEIKKNIVKLGKDTKSTDESIKWVSAENLHITLKFLGWVEDKNLDKLIKLTSKAVAGKGSFKAQFAGMGTFPQGKSPRVIWVGTVEGGQELCKIAKNLDETLAQAGFKSEARDFKSHITVGRVKQKLKNKLELTKDQKFGEMIVDRIYIMKSTLTRKGPIYEKFKEVKL